MAQKFTDSFMRRVLHEVPPTRDTIYVDTQLPRFYLRLQPPSASGRTWPASWGIRVSHRIGRSTKIRLADARTVAPDKAREIARKRLAAIAAGEPARLETPWTVRDLWDHYEKSQQFLALAQHTRKQRISITLRHILPFIGNEQLRHINLPMMRRLCASVIELTKKQRYKGRTFTGEANARCAIMVIQAMLNWAAEQGRLNINPLQGGQLRLPPPRNRETVITEPEQYAKLFDTMANMVALGELRPEVRNAIVLIAATGMRRNEARELTWGQVDLANRRITLRDSKGAKLARGGIRTETISIPPIAAVAVAEQLPPFAPDPTDRVFAVQRGKLIDINSHWMRIRREAGLPDDLVLHGLRHSLGTASVMAGFSAAETQALLRHRSLKVTSKYIHLADNVRARLADRVAAHLFPDDTSTDGATATIHKFPTKAR
jgi:integrase